MEYPLWLQGRLAERFIALTLPLAVRAVALAAWK